MLNIVINLGYLSILKCKLILSYVGDWLLMDMRSEFTLQLAVIN